LGKAKNINENSPLGAVLGCIGNIGKENSLITSDSLSPTLGYWFRVAVPPPKSTKNDRTEWINKTGKEITANSKVQK
jgi:hypothetical protein